MISFSDIADRLAEKRAKYSFDRDEKYEKDWKPERCTDFVVPPFSLRPPSDAKGAKAKWQNKLINIYTLYKERATQAL